MKILACMIVIMFIIIVIVLHHHNQKIKDLHVEIHRLQDMINSTNTTMRDIYTKVNAMQKDIQYLQGKIHSLCDDD